MPEHDLILASASPRRHELLARCRVPFSVVISAVDESVADRERPADYVLRLARAKAAAVHRLHPDHFVLGADTTVVAGGRILGKPENADQAAAMLRRLSGCCHDVLSAVALRGPDGRQWARLSTTQVEFAELPAAWISAYVASGEGMDKAGAYGIQNDAGLWIRRLSGSYSAVVGLPLFETFELLREAGLVRF